MRKIILNLAISLDGRIVDESGGYDWIKGDGNNTNDTKKQLDFAEFTNSCDTMIFGKKAYDDIDLPTLENFNDKQIIVLTHNYVQPQRKNVTFFSGDLPGLVNDLKSKKGSNIWVWGGSSVCNILVKSDQIDEYIVGVIPTIVGKGIRLFADDNPMLELSLKECTVIDGITMLVYERRN